MTRQPSVRVVAGSLTMLALAGVLSVRLIAAGSPEVDEPDARSSHTAAAPQGDVIWSEDFEAASQFRSTPWNNLPEAPARPRSENARHGQHVGRYTVPAGLDPRLDGRSENVPDLPAIRPGDDLWFAFSTQLETGFPLDTPHWQVLAQWKDEGDGSPPLALYVVDGQFRVGGGYGDPRGPRVEERFLGTAMTEHWDDWLFHVRFSSDPSDGLVQVWRNGRPVLAHWKPPHGTMYPGLTSYLKVGYYRSREIRTAASVLHDGWKVWTTGRFTRG